MPIAPGNCLNSAASLFLTAGIPAVCHTTRIALNECSFGFVPHAGATYLCSRMEGDLGTFLALTGMPLSGSDALKLELADMYVKDPVNFEDNIIVGA